MANTPAKRLDHVGPHRTAFEKNRKKIFATSGVCGICGQPVDISIKNHLDPMAPVVDHIVPIAKGGHPSDISNLQLAHRWCNRQKADKLFDRRKFVEDNTEVKNNDLPQHFDWAAYMGGG